MGHPLSGRNDGRNCCCYFPLEFIFFKTLYESGIKINEFIFIFLFYLNFFSVSHLNRSDSTNSNSDNSDDEIPPHCHITIRCTREIAGFNGLGEAVRRLDFRSSVRDRRRFQYVCSLLRLLVSHKGIANLPGSAQRLLLQMLEEVAEHGIVISL